MLINVACGALATRSVSCSPAPDAFNPCEDVMGRSWLRAAVWLVLVAALLGNLAVMLVLLSSRFSLSVSKFLMCHLAFADFCMGAYLLLLAAVDAHSAGAYFNHAIPWQHGTGCQVAGFLTVFASELSIFTLTVITLERWYAITYAIHLNRRLKLRTAAKVMTAGWAVAGLAASLPLLGVSSYTKTSICLPMETRGPRDLAYLAALLSGNGLAFLLICACYGKMYASIAGRHASAGDTTVAKRMALLVFTDFACWAPIAFFGLTAVAGYPLIDVTNSKILLVFFYPLNSCANPFLYAILTKQYRRDLFVLLSRYGFCTRRAMRYKDTSSVLHTAPNNRGILLSLQGNHRQRDVITPAVETEEETQSSTHRGSPHPIRNSYTKMSSVSQCASIPVDD
ncbi:thyrotropin receptor [Ixodes scapularis]|nr:thyrotropin receptor [Ixodes scapularis]